MATALRVGRPLPTMLLLGGFGLAFPAMITLAISGVPDSDAGVASGLVNTTQQVGAALGVAVLSTLAAARTGHLLTAGRPAADALTAGYHVAFGIGAGLAGPRSCSPPRCCVPAPPGAGRGPRTSPGGRTGSVPPPIVGWHHDRLRAVARYPANYPPSRTSSPRASRRPASPRSRSSARTRASPSS